MPEHLETLRWNNSFAGLAEAFYQRVTPTPLPNPVLIAANPGAAELLDLDPKDLTRPEFVGLLNGAPVSGPNPIAAIYAGHQFGVWVPQLGDGRAILLGEVLNSRHERWDVQLKGAGLTRFSRMGDGRAVLRSTIREYLGSEAMHGLGIPTTRALAILGSDAPVYRERIETAAVLARLAPTHVRFGSFELFASRNQRDLVQQLADYVIDLHFPELLRVPASDRYNAWYREVVERTARLMAQWMAAGFAHGVMNTDNMSILGLSLDYGPYGWLDRYDHGFIPNHSDPAGRYAFDQQPMVGLWNSARLGEALFPLITEPHALESLERYRATYEEEMARLMNGKLGLVQVEADDFSLVSDLLAVLQASGADYTRFFRILSRYRPANTASHAAIMAECDQHADVPGWLARYDARLTREGGNDAERIERMLATNPKYVLRNWIAQEAIALAEQGSHGRIEEIRQLLAAPFSEQPAFERYAEKPPEWAREVAVSCSS